MVLSPALREESTPPLGGLRRLPAPAEAPAVFSLLQAIELPSPEDDDSGVFYPRGGWSCVRDALPLSNS